MKTRNDFVSNSSSCSFVVAIPSEAQYKFKDFVKDLVKDCAKNKDQEYDMTKEQLQELNEFNARNLDYHLNSSELLFLGTLKVTDSQCTMKNPSMSAKDYDNIDDFNYVCEMFERLQKDVKRKNFGKDTGEKLVEATDNAITVSYPVYASGIAMPSMDMRGFTSHYSWCTPDKETKEDRKHAADNILRLMNIIKNPEDSDLYHFVNTHTYFISKNTIWNTRALLENNAELTLEKWENLDELEKRLDEGQRLFVIRQNNGGDGWDNNAIYGLGGWDAKFGDKAAVEVLHSECM